MLQIITLIMICPICSSSLLFVFFQCPICKWRYSGMFLWWSHVLVLLFLFSLTHGFRLLQTFNDKSNRKSPCVFLHLCVSHCSGAVNEDNVKTHGVRVGMWGWWSGNSSCTLYSYIIANMQVLSPFASVIDDTIYYVVLQKTTMFGTFTLWERMFIEL